MTMLRRLLYLVIILPFISQANPTSVDFYTGSLTVAKQKAAQEGKLYFVDFVASWCMPCRWMDETTFSNPDIAAYMADNYIPVKVDIDNFDGYAYKQQYNVKVLPTILIFNSKGKLVGRYEESLPPSKLIKILAKHNTTKNRVATASKPQPPQSVNRPAIASRPDLMISKPTAPQRPVIQSAPTLPAPPKVTKPSPAAPSKPSPTSDALYRFSVRHQATVGFSVQVGVYGDYENLIREAAKVEEKFDDAILVHIAKFEAKTVYKILVGEFNTREEAIQFQAFLKQKGIPGFIKDLSTL